MLGLKSNRVSKSGDLSIDYEMCRSPMTYMDIITELNPKRNDIWLISVGNRRPMDWNFIEILTRVGMLANHQTVSVLKYIDNRSLLQIFVSVM